MPFRVRRQLNFQPPGTFKPGKRRPRMKKGLIVYVTEGKEDVEMAEVRSDSTKPLSVPGVDSLRLAVSEDDIVYYWWQLVSRGMSEVSCMKGTYDAAKGEIALFGAPMRLCG
jgi:hypothetical protein